MLLSRQSLPADGIFEDVPSSFLRSTILSSRYARGCTRNLFRTKRAKSPCESEGFFRRSRKSHDRSGGIFHDMLSHDFDMIHYLSGQFPTAAYSVGHAYLPEIKEMDDVRGDRGPLSAQAQ